MTIKEGDVVRLRRLGIEGVVEKVLPSRKVIVRIGDLQSKVSTDDLVAVNKSELRSSASEKQSRNNRKPEVAPVPQQKGGRRRGITSVDLHGLSGAEAVTVLERTLSEALMNEVESFKVIPGIGTGKLKEVVLGFVRNSKHVKAYKWDPYNPGVVVIYL